MSMKRLLPAMMLASAGIGFSPIHAQLVVDYNRNGRIDAGDETTATLPQQEVYRDGGFQRTGAIVWVNLDYDEAENQDPGLNGLPARIIDGRPAPDSIRFHHDGLNFEATDEDFVLRAGEAGWERTWPDFTPPPAGEYRSLCPDIAPLKIKRMDTLPAPTRVYLEVGSALQRQAFHVFKKIPDFDDPAATEQTAIWGAYDAAVAPWKDGDANARDIEITQWVNEHAPGFEDTRPAGQTDFVLGIEGMLYRGMPYGFADGEVDRIFPGIVTLKLVLVDSAGVRTVKGKVRMTFLRLPAFPGAEGFGRWATGGRGGEIVRVSKTEDLLDLSSAAAANTLRWAVDESKQRI